MHLANKPVGYLGTTLVGVAFGAGWTPCLGPILGAILTYTAATADLSRGLPLLLAYSLGLALPFLLAAVAVERFLAAVTRIRPYLARVSQISGVLLIIVGVMMMLDYFTTIGVVPAGGDAGGDSEQAVGSGVRGSEARRPDARRARLQREYPCGAGSTCVAVTGTAYAVRA